MSITTGKGDHGQTDLLFGRRVAKNDPRIIALGALDSLNAGLGLARARCPDDERMESIQRNLMSLMGEVATLPEDEARAREAGFETVRDTDVERLGSWIGEIESRLPPARDWALPGARGDLLAARLDAARALCRQAESAVVGLSPDPDIITISPTGCAFLNRLSDFLWLRAREVEQT